MAFPIEKLPHRRGSALSSRPVIAVDLGGTRIRAAVVLPDGTRVARTERPTPTEQGPEAIVDACRAVARASRAAAAVQLTDELAGIGISSPGPVDPVRGMVVEPPNLGPEFRDIKLAAALGEAEDLPAFLDRDTNVAALGEQAFGAARGVDDFIYLTVSTGIGGSIVTGGEILHGPDGFAGELGHVVVEMDGPRCGCGGPGHVEAIAAGVSLAREARALVATDQSPYLAEQARKLGGPEALSAREVAEGALAGDPACAYVMDRARRALSAACVGYVNAFNPHRIVIGGSIAEAEGERLLQPIRDAIASEVFKIVARGVTVVPAALGGDVSLAGAQPLVMRALAGARTVDATRGAPGGTTGDTATTHTDTATATTPTDPGLSADRLTATPGGISR
ncbi:MAG TPA: ROK family protein [Candidatus Limnocylindrales bacterium]|nr:ROK family protein [Candidatus Limnocylindrales bacterium]